eukprot:gene28844-32033_t
MILTHHVQQIGSVVVKVTWKPFLGSTAILDEKISPNAALSGAVDANDMQTRDPSQIGISKSGVSKSLASGAPMAPPSEVRSTPSKVVMPCLRCVNTNISRTLKGVLTVNLIRCTSLDEPIPNFYVRFICIDPNVDEDTDQVHRSSTIFNETNPRWGSAFDFVMVSAHAQLYINVHAVKAGIGASISKQFGKLAFWSEKKKDEDGIGASISKHCSKLCFWPEKKKDEQAMLLVEKKKDEDVDKDVDKVVGKLQISLRDVAQNSSLKDVWTLNDAEKGNIELELKWHLQNLRSSYVLLVARPCALRMPPVPDTA